MIGLRPGSLTVPQAVIDELHDLHFNTPWKRPNKRPSGGAACGLYFLWIFQKGFNRLHVSDSSRSYSRAYKRR